LFIGEKTLNVQMDDFEGWIKMPVDKEVGIGPGHIVLDEDPVGTQPPQQPFPTFGPCLLWPWL